MKKTIHRTEQDSGGSWKATTGMNWLLAGLATLVAALTFLAARPADAATRTWNGNTSANWNDAANWDEGALGSGNTPTFGAAGTSGTTLSNNTPAGTAMAGLTFTSNAPSYTLNGSDITLAGNILVSNGAHTINLNLGLNNSRTLQVVGGTRLVVNGAISNNWGLTVGGSSGSGGTVTLNATNTYTGVTQISQRAVLEAAVLANGGVSSSIGASGNGAANLVFSVSGGTLRYIGNADVVSDRGIRYNNNQASIIESSGGGTLSFDSSVGIDYNSTNTVRNLYFGGTNTGTNTFAKSIADVSDAVSVPVYKTGAGRWILTGASNTYSGATTVSGGALEVGNDAASLSATSYLKLDGGVLQANGVFARSNSTAASGGSFQWTTNGGGFSAQGGKLTVTVGNNAAIEQTNRTAAANNAILGSLMFGSASADSEMEFRNNINLNGLVGTVNVTAGAGGDFATLSGAIRNTSSSNAVGIVKTGTGTLNLTAANTYNGATVVSNGTLLVNNTTGSGTGSGVVTVTPGGYIGGNGTVSNTLIMAGGGLAATVGNVLKVQGNVDLSAVNDSLVLVGPAPAARTVVLTYTGTLTGTFNSTVGIVADYSVDKEIAIRPPGAPGTTLSVR